MGDQSGGQSLEAAGINNSKDFETRQKSRLGELKDNFSKRGDNTWDYESDTIERYTMISSEFDYD